SVASETLSYPELRHVAKELKQKVLDLPQVSSVREHGLLDREIKIKIDSQKAQQLQVAPRDVLNAIKARNIRASAGTFENNAIEKSVETLAEFVDPLEVENVIVRSSFNGPAIYVKDVAEVIDGFEDEVERSRVNGNRAISFEVIKKGSADIIATADAVNLLAIEQNNFYGDDVQVFTSGDRSVVVKNRLSVVFNNGLIGLAFV